MLTLSLFVLHSLTPPPHTTTTTTTDTRLSHRHTTHHSQGAQLIELLKKNPAVAIPVVIIRLEQKEAEWYKVREGREGGWCDRMSSLFAIHCHNFVQRDYLRLLSMPPPPSCIRSLIRSLAFPLTLLISHSPSHSLTPHSLTLHRSVRR